MIKCLSETSEIIIISAIISQQVTHSGHEHYVIIILSMSLTSQFAEKEKHRKQRRQVGEERQPSEITLLKI